MRQFFYIILLVTGFLGISLPTSARGEEATQVIKRLQTSLLTVMKEADHLDYQNRYRQLEPTVEETHDLPAVARLSVGKYWRDLQKEQQDLFVKTFHQLSIATYASRFKGYSGEHFNIVSEKPTRGHRVLVESRLIKSDGKQIHFNYLLHRVGGQWRILNIVVNGVSDLALKRTEYTGLLKTKGFQALIGKLQNQIHHYADGK